MRLPAYFPKTPLPLYSFVRSHVRGLQVYISNDPQCKQPQCTISRVAVFTPEGFANWERKLKDATLISLPNNIQGYLLSTKGKDADYYVIWKQEGSRFVLGIDHRALSQAELVKLAASMVSEPPIR